MSATESVADRLAAVRARIDRAAASAARDPRTIRLVAVSKTKSPEAVREAYAAGQRDFGESYAQELVEKATALADLPDLRWHFVGHLQTNKAKLVAAHAHFVHSVDSAALAHELGRRVERLGRGPIPVLIEVNVAGEATKHGAAPQDIEEVMRAVRAERALELRGLMTIPPLGDLEEARRVFSALVSLRNLHGGAAELPELSMGMSDDLEIAVAQGATFVRIGTAIFGPRA